MVVDAPLLVTCCKVEVLAAVPGQFNPVARHTLMPFTRTAPAFNVVPDAVANPSHTLDVAAVKAAFVIVPLVANKFVVVTLVAVPFVNVSVPSVVPPITVKVEVTVDDEPMNPPYNCKVAVAKEPRAETVASVSASPGQNEPLCKQTSWPATYICVAEANVAPKYVVVTCEKVALVAVIA